MLWQARATDGGLSQRWRCSDGEGSDGDGSAPRAGSQSDGDGSGLPERWRRKRALVAMATEAGSQSNSAAMAAQRWRRKRSPLAQRTSSASMPPCPAHLTRHTLPSRRCTPASSARPGTAWWRSSAWISGKRDARGSRPKRRLTLSVPSTYRAGSGARRGVAIQPRCAHTTEPLTGECGSRAVSECAWCSWWCTVTYSR